MTVPSALILGLAGLIPFLWGAVTVLVGTWPPGPSGHRPRFAGPYVMIFYGAIILSFMSGVLWGFSTRREGSQAAAGYVLSVIPALWAFFMTGGGPTGAGVSLMAGFAGLLALDWFFWRNGADAGLVDAAAPAAEPRVLACLAVGVIFA